MDVGGESSDIFFTPSVLRLFSDEEFAEIQKGGDLVANEEYFDSYKRIVVRKLKTRILEILSTAFKVNDRFSFDLSELFDEAFASAARQGVEITSAGMKDILDRMEAGRLHKLLLFVDAVNGNSTAEDLVYLRPYVVRLFTYDDLERIYAESSEFIGYFDIYKGEAVNVLKQKTLDMLSGADGDPFYEELLEVFERLFKDALDPDVPIDVGTMLEIQVRMEMGGLEELVLLLVQQDLVDCLARKARASEEADELLPSRETLVEDLEQANNVIYLLSEESNQLKKKIRDDRYERERDAPPRVRLMKLLRELVGIDKPGENIGRRINKMLTDEKLNITDLSHIFFDCAPTEKDKDRLSRWEGSDLWWETGRVRNMKGMFKGCKMFNAEVQFDTRNVEDMSEMFEDCIRFNSPLLFSDTGRVKTTRAMFKYARAFNKPLYTAKQLYTVDGGYTESAWDLSSNRDTSQMFMGASSFNQHFRSSRDRPFDLNRVETMKQMFAEATSFNRSVTFDASLCKTMEKMFDGAEAFNSRVAFKQSWRGALMVRYSDFTEGPIYVESAAYMFRNCRALNFPLSMDLRSCVSFEGMFLGATSLNSRVRLVSTAVQIADDMFREARAYNSPLPFVSPEGSALPPCQQLYTARRMFYQASKFNQPVQALESALRLESASEMFHEAEEFDKPVLLFSPVLTDIARMFKSAKNMNSEVHIESPGLTTLQGMFRRASSFNAKLTFTSTSQVKVMHAMFYEATSFNQPVKLDANSLVTAKNMFYKAVNFNSSLVLRNSAKLITTEGMFDGAVAFNQQPGIMTASVRNMKNMFRNTKSLITDLSYIRVDSLRTALGIFDGSSYTMYHNNFVPSYALVDEKLLQQQQQEADSDDDADVSI